MLTLNCLRVRGFRGFLDVWDFPLGSPITILFGQNRCGKSSTLNAVEWDLFGDACSGKETNIRERIDWPIANRHAKPSEVAVELEMNSPDGKYLVRRELRPLARRKNPEERVEVELPDGECLTGAKAALFLDRLLCSTFRDFATTVYQHQEAIRAIVTEEPRNRNDAIDRLLGLSDHRNLLSALQKVNPKGWRKDFLVEWGTFESAVGTALSTREKDLRDLRDEATKAGVPRNKLNAKAVLTFAGGTLQALNQFAIETRLEPASIPVPREWFGLKLFCKEVRTAINRHRGEIPAAKEQEELIERRGKVIGIQADLRTAAARQAEIGNGIRGLDIEYGGQNAIPAQLGLVKKAIGGEKARLREADGRASLINEAITFLAAEEDKHSSSDLCPVCNNKAPGLLGKLRQQWGEKLQSQSEQIKAKIQSLQEQKEKLEGAAESYQDWNNELERVAEKLGRCRREVGALIQREIQSGDDPAALLNAEADKIKSRLETLSKAVEAKQTRLSEIEEELERVRIIDDILHQEEKKRIIEQIQQSQEFQELDSLRDRAAELVADLEAIREAISEVSNEEARDKLAAAETAIDRYFRQLTRHPAVRAIKVEISADARSQRNNYAITDQDGKDLTAILSQGDLNALALAIFLGLAASTKDSGSFGFVLMDDPSQSLDSEHKRQLVLVLNEVAQNKQLVLATMDREFRNYLAEGLTKAKTEYVFEAWTPENGPTITRKD